MVKILIIGDTSGKSDEGMKKTCQQISRCLSSSIHVTFVSVPDVLKNLSRFRKTDIIHYMAGPSWRSLFYAFFLKIILGHSAKTIVSFIHPQWSKLAGLFFRLFKPDALIVQSEKWKQYCQGFGVLIYDELILGVDLEKFKPVSISRRDEIRKHLGLPLDKKIVLHVGHLNPGRNLSLMAEFKEDSNILPIVIGSTTVIADNKIVRFLENSGVRVIHKFLSNIEMFYQAADCYVFPVVNPHSCIQLPLSVLEALACGTPVVTTRFEGLPYYLPDEFAGLTYMDNFSAVRQHVQQCICSNIRPDTEKLCDFSWKKITIKLEAFYKEVLAL